MISSTQFAQGIAQFMQGNVLPKTEEWKQFAGGMMIGMVANRADAMARELAKNPMVKAMGVVAENGDIDADALFDAAQAQFGKQSKLPIDIPVIGQFIFDESDLRDLRRAVMGH